MLRKEAKTLEQAQGLGGRLASTKLYIICLVSNTTIILYRQEGRGIGFTPKISAYALQDRGYDTYEANVCLGFKPDERDYAPAFQMLRALGIHRIRLLSNNPDKCRQLNEYGLEIDAVENLYGRVTEYNKEYIATKISKFHHKTLAKVGCEIGGMS